MARRGLRGACRIQVSDSDLSDTGSCYAHQVERGRPSMCDSTDALAGYEAIRVILCVVLNVQAHAPGAWPLGMAAMRPRGVVIAAWD